MDGVEVDGVDKEFAPNFFEVDISGCSLMLNRYLKCVQQDIKNSSISNLKYGTNSQETLPSQLSLFSNLHMVPKSKATPGDIFLR